MKNLKSLAGIALALLCGQAEAALLKGHFSASGPVDQTVTVQTTDLKFVSLQTWLDTIPSENDISCTVTGAVEMDVWPFPDVALQQASGTRTWVKRELYPFSAHISNVAARTTSISPGSGAGRWTCKALNGADQTGSFSTYVVGFNATSAPVTTWSLGQGNRAGYGGYDLSQLPGVVSNKTITAQTTPGALAIFSQSSRIAWAGTYGSTTRTVGTPAAGAAAYTAVVTDSALGQSWSVVFDVNATELNAAPATGDTAAANQLVTISKDALCPGQDVVIEGDFIGWNPTITTTLLSACPSTPSIGFPSTPYAITTADPTGWRPDGALTFPATPNAGVLTANPGWITFRCRFVLSCSIVTTPSAANSSLIVNRGTGTAANIYFRLTNIRDSVFPATTSGGFTAISWLMQDHSIPIYDVDFTAGYGSAVAWNHENDRATNLFMRDNYVNTRDYTVGAPGPQSGLLAGGMTVVGRDSQQIGNEWDHTSVGVTSQTVDKIGSLVYNSTIGDGKTAVSWNFVKNTATTGAGHIDYIQPAMNASTVAGVTLYRDNAVTPPGATIEIGDYIGNVFSRGFGNYVTQATIDAGFATQSQFNQGYEGATEGMFMKNSGATTYRSDINHIIRVVGNIENDNAQHGMDMMKQANGSVFSNNLNTFDYALLWGQVNSTGCANLPTPVTCLQPSGSLGNGTQIIHGFETNEGPGVSVIRNIHANLTIPYYLSGGAATTFANNFMPGLGTTTSTHLAQAQAQWADPVCGEACQTLQDFIDHFTPKAGSTLGMPTSAGKPIGPFAPVGVTPLLDYRRRLYAPSVLLP